MVGQWPALHISSCRAMSEAAMPPSTPGSSSALASRTSTFVDLNPGRLSRAANVAGSNCAAPGGGAAPRAGGVENALGPLIEPPALVGPPPPHVLPDPANAAGIARSCPRAGTPNSGTGVPDIKIAPLTPGPFGPCSSG